MSKTAKIVIAAVVAVVAIGGFTAWWFLRDTAPDELSVDDVTTTTADGEPTTSAGGSGSPTSEATGFDGTWTVVQGDDTEAGLRIDEEFAGGAATHTAVGRTTDVEGSLEVAGSQVSSASFTVNLTDLTWSDSPGFPTENRTRALSDEGLETDQFPDATFELTEPVDFGAVPADGEKKTVDVTGSFTLHGVTEEITFSIDAVRQGDNLVVGTTEPVEVVLADYDIDKPTAPMVASIADAGSFEFVVVLSQG